ncbi:MAG: HAD family hydrolase [Gammaproteobacteria bacterium]|nr:HAD family hydrolase [Gammaproteobacteria bacterium]
MLNPGDVLLFDLDGTLVRSVEFDHGLYLEAITEVLGHSDYDADWSTYTHVTDTGLLTELLERLGIKDTSPIISAVRALFCAKVEAYLSSGGCCDAMPGARETLSALTAAGIPFGIATGGWGPTARMKLQSAGFEIPTAISSSDDAISRVDIMRHCLQQLGAIDSQAVYFGDAHWDIRATSELGWRFVGVGTRLADRCTPIVVDFRDPWWVKASSRLGIHL